MKFVVGLILTLILPLTSASSQPSVCVSALSDYSQAVTELVQSQARLEASKANGSESEAQLIVHERENATKEAELLALMDAEEFARAFAKAKALIKPVDTNEVRQGRRERADQEATAFSHWELIQTHTLKEGYFDDLKVSRDGQKLLAQTNNNVKPYERWIVIDLVTGEEKLLQLKEDLNAAQFSKDGKKLFGLTAESLIEIDVVSGSSQILFNVNANSKIFSINESKKIVAQADEQQIIVHDFSGQILKTLKAPKIAPFDFNVYGKFEISPNGKFIVARIVGYKLSNSIVRIWDIETDTYYDVADVYDFAFGPTANKIILGTLNGQITARSLKTRVIKSEFQVDLPLPETIQDKLSYLVSIDLSLDGKKLLTTVSGSKIQVYDLQNAKLTDVFKLHGVDKTRGPGIWARATFGINDQIVGYYGKYFEYWQLKKPLGEEP